MRTVRQSHRARPQPLGIYHPAPSLLPRGTVVPQSAALWDKAIALKGQAKAHLCKATVGQSFMFHSVSLPHAVVSPAPQNSPPRPGVPQCHPIAIGASTGTLRAAAPPKFNAGRPGRVIGLVEYPIDIPPPDDPQMGFRLSEE